MQPFQLAECILLYCMRCKPGAGDATSQRTWDIAKRMEYTPVCNQGWECTVLRWEKVVTSSYIMDFQLTYCDIMHPPCRKEVTTNLGWPEYRILKTALANDSPNTYDTYDTSTCFRFYTVYHEGKSWNWLMMPDFTYILSSTQKAAKIYRDQSYREECVY